MFRRPTTTFERPLVNNKITVFFSLGSKVFKCTAYFVLVYGRKGWDKQRTEQRIDSFDEQNNALYSSDEPLGTLKDDNKPAGVKVFWSSCCDKESLKVGLS